MEIRPGDLIQLKKDIERIRQHEEKRRSNQAAENPEQTVQIDSNTPASSTSSTPVSVRIREAIADFWGPPAPSGESLEIIPEYLVTLIQVIREEPKFRHWLLQLDAMPAPYRNEQLKRMSHAFRIEDADSPIATAFDQLHETALFQAVCQYLRDETASPS